MSSNVASAVATMVTVTITAATTTIECVFPAAPGVHPWTTFKIGALVGIVTVGGQAGAAAGGGGPGVEGGGGGGGTSGGAQFVLFYLHSFVALFFCHSFFFISIKN